jgi:protein involved in ribonucleotide reduction
MLLVYASRTGNVRRFMSKVELPSIVLTNDLTVNEPYILITYTDKFGEVPEHVKEFLGRTDKDLLQGVAASGNRNWGDRFAKSADVISRNYHVPIILKFEIAGTKKDVEYFKKRVEELENESCGVKQRSPEDQSGNGFLLARKG